VLNKANKQAILFALATCFVCSLLLAGASDTLRPIIEKNKIVDVKKNILKALKIEYKAESTLDEIEKVYADKVVPVVINKDGSLSDKKMEDVTEKDGLLKVYQSLKDGKPSGYAIPVVGPGLWGPMYGYLALEPDLNTVKGITFYSHIETPGLGAEISADWFQNNFVGKKVLDESGKLVSIKVIKGKVEPGMAAIEHKVDGISGATMTANGVTNLLIKDLNTYEPYFSKIRGGK
jgi:Na+-transporting NADH:ubiquinone oxidoreductase subunit C